MNLDGSRGSIVVRDIQLFSGGCVGDNHRGRGTTGFDAIVDSDEFDEGQLTGITETNLGESDNAEVTAVAGFEAFGDVGEKDFEGILVAEQ